MLRPVERHGRSVLGLKTATKKTYLCMYNCIYMEHQQLTIEVAPHLVHQSECLDRPDPSYLQHGMDFGLKSNQVTQCSQMGSRLWHCLKRLWELGPDFWKELSSNELGVVIDPVNYLALRLRELRELVSEHGSTSTSPSSCLHLEVSFHFCRYLN